MIIPSTLLTALESNGFKVSTDTRKDVSGSVYFALKGDSFDGSTFIHQALQNGAILAVTENHAIAEEKVLTVDNVLEALQKSANIYRKTFSIPIIAIGGSNGKTTSKELLKKVLQTKYKLHATAENLNNHIGVPLSILSMNKDSEIGLFEIGANHKGEHTELLDVLEPNIVIVTNNGLDHLEGFGSPEGVRQANKEIYDWAKSHDAVAFVNKNHTDLIEDSAEVKRIIYPTQTLEIISSSPLVLKFENKKYPTQLVGSYNLENIQLAIAIGKHFGIDANKALEEIRQYIPSLKRSEFLVRNGINFIVDCYNANPSSMKAALDSFSASSHMPKGVILGDMLELGPYADTEHLKIVKYIEKKKIDCVIYVGENFKRALDATEFKSRWFPDSLTASEWFAKQDFKGYTFLLKGSRGLKIEKVLEI